MQKWYDCTGEEKGPECFSPRHPSARENGFSATPFSVCLIFYSEWSHRNSHSFEVAIITADIAASTATVLQTNRSPKEQSLKMRKQPKGGKKMGLRWGGRGKTDKGEEGKKKTSSKTKSLNVICTSGAIKARRRRRETGTRLWMEMRDNKQHDTSDKVTSEVRACLPLSTSSFHCQVSCVLNDYYSASTSWQWAAALYLSLSPALSLCGYWIVSMMPLDDIILFGIPSSRLETFHCGTWLSSYVSEIVA